MTYKLDKAKILIVDDMKPMLSLTKSILKVFGFKEVHLAQNGEEAFKMVCTHDPDIILTDWLMSPVDGLEFTKMIRKNPLAPNPYVPILMMTGYSSRIRVEEARDFGITEFLVKPFSAHDLYLRIAQIVEKPRQFVDTGQFFGPDRRRKHGKDYMGPRRREIDTRSAAAAGDEKAMEILKKLRDEAKSV
jgi:CheY-like chemotaxis protein